MDYIYIFRIPLGFFTSSVFFTIIYCLKNYLYDFCYNKKCKTCKHICHEKNQCSHEYTNDEMIKFYPENSHPQYYNCKNCSHYHESTNKCDKFNHKTVQRPKKIIVQEQKFVKNINESYNENVLAGYENEKYNDTEIYDYDNVPYEEITHVDKVVGTRQEPYTVQESKLVDEPYRETYFVQESCQVPYTDYGESQRSRQVTKSYWDGTKFVNGYDTIYYMEKYPIYKQKTEYKQVQKYRNATRQVTKYNNVTKYRTVNITEKVPVSETKYKKVPKYRTVEKVRQKPVYKIVMKTRQKPIYETISTEKEIIENVNVSELCECANYIMGDFICSCENCLCDECNPTYCNKLSEKIKYLIQILIGTNYIGFVISFILVMYYILKNI